jgi:hypothetical protein
VESGGPAQCRIDGGREQTDGCGECRGCWRDGVCGLFAMERGGGEGAVREVGGVQACDVRGMMSRGRVDVLDHGRMLAAGLEAHGWCWASGRLGWVAQWLNDGRSSTTWGRR